MTKILVVEDEVSLSAEVIGWLVLEGYSALGVDDGIAGVAAAFRHQPDLIICDIMMPGLDGYGVLLELRADPATADIPFIFVTARAAYEDIRRGMTYGADDYLTKPFTRQQLLQAIDTRLRRKLDQDQVHQNNLAQWQQAFEQKHEQLLFKAKLVAMFAHDFRNPLTAILASNEYLREFGSSQEESRRLRHFGRIDAAVRQLLQMLDDMLVVSQMETGNLDFKPAELNLQLFLQDIVDEFQIIYAESHKLVFESHDSASMLADPRLLRQIVTNLISNALKYSPQGTEVRVILERHSEKATVSVCDHGIGIPEVDRPRLFAAFQRASNVGSVTGTGLGLAIVKQAVDLHGGSIDLKSTVGVGTTITVAIPAQ